MRKKIEISTEKIRVAKLKEEDAKKVCSLLTYGFILRTSLGPYSLSNLKKNSPFITTQRVCSIYLAFFPLCMLLCGNYFELRIPSATMSKALYLEGRSYP